MARQETLEKLTEHLETFDDATLETLLHLVERIPPQDDAWDRQIREDALTGKLDKLADRALKDYLEGNVREL